MELSGDKSSFQRKVSGELLASTYTETVVKSEKGKTLYSAEEVKYRKNLVLNIDNFDAARVLRFDPLKGKIERSVKKGRGGMFRKVFKTQESLLSEKLNVDDFNSIKNMFISIFLFLSLSVAIQDYFYNGDLLIKLYSSLSGFTIVVKVWIRLLILSLIDPLLFHFWNTKFFSNATYIFTVSTLQSILFYISASTLRGNGLSILSKFYLAIEQIRISMKIHAFMVETYRMISEPEDTTESRVDRNALSTLRNVFWNFFYFLWAPTLVYRNSYPRVQRVNWKSLFEHSIMFLASCLFLFVTFEKYCFFSFACKDTGPLEPASLVLSFIHSTIPATTLYLITFFCVLHCWMNIGAELTRFGDRKFYTDWWNSRSYEEYFRKWNMVVGDFIFSYIFSEFHRFGLSKAASRFMTFALSAFLHEFILWEVLGFFFPLIFIFFLGFGILFIYLTRFMPGNRHWNLFFWITLMLGNGMLLVLYTREFQARYSDSASTNQSSWWIPLSWQSVN